MSKKEITFGIKTEFGFYAPLNHLNLTPDLMDLIQNSRIPETPAALDLIRRMQAAQLNQNNFVNLIKGISHCLEAIHIYGPEFFQHKNGVVPQLTIYACLAKGLHFHYPEYFEGLNNSYFELLEETEHLDISPEDINKPNISNSARFVFLLNTYLLLESYRDDLRAAKISADVNDNYHLLVQNAKVLKVSDKILSKDIRHMTQEIDFIVNHHDNPAVWYIPYAATHGEKIFDADWLYEALPVPKSELVRQAFQVSYDHFKKYDTKNNLDSFYAFAEQVLNPYGALEVASLRKMTETDIVYSFLEPVIRSGENDINPAYFGPEFEEMLRIAESSLPVAMNDDAIADRKEISVTLSSCQITCSMRIAVMHMSGDRINPIYTLDDMKDLGDVLKDASDIPIYNRDLREVWHSYWSQAARLYNDRVIKYNLPLPSLAPII